MPALLGYALRAFHAVTEFEDFVDCLHGALPRKAQAKGVRPGKRAARRTINGRLPSDPTRTKKVALGKKLNAIYRNVGSIDFRSAAECVILDWLEDEAIGRTRGKLTPRPSDGPRLGPFI